jgi:hypothetical protein
MAAPATVPNVAVMPYATITHLPELSTRHAQIVAAALGQRPDGLLASLVGEVNQELWIVEVWASQAQHDRFVAELLYPALHRSGRRLAASMTHLAIAIHHLHLPSTAPAANPEGTPL